MFLVPEIISGIVRYSVGREMKETGVLCFSVPSRSYFSLRSRKRHIFSQLTEIAELWRARFVDTPASKSYVRLL